MKLNKLGQIAQLKNNENSNELERVRAQRASSTVKITSTLLHYLKSCLEVGSCK